MLPIPNWPMLFAPQQYARPPTAIAHVKESPTLISVKRKLVVTAVGVFPIPVPQQYATPCWLSAHTLEAPTLTLSKSTLLDTRRGVVLHEAGVSLNAMEHVVVTD